LIETNVLTTIPPANHNATVTCQAYMLANDNVTINCQSYIPANHNKIVTCHSYRSANQNDNHTDQPIITSISQTIIHNG